MRDEILMLFEKNRSMNVKELQKELGITTSRDFKEMCVCLNELEDERKLYNNHVKYILIDNKNLVAGKARDVSPMEYAVFNRENKVYVPKTDSRILLDSDEVLVKVSPKGNEVVHIYERGIKYVVGTFVNTRRGLKFRSDVDLHTSFDVLNEKDFALSNNMKAVVKVVEYTAPLKVKIVKLLGKEDEPGVDVTGILCENEVRMDFGKKVQKELDEIPTKVRKKEIKDRYDLRALPTVTIDGDSTKDFDDAISVEKLPNGGWRLYVHIADVSHYVKEDEAIDEEAFKRGTSIYVTDRVVPMLPFQLSNGICSLNPDVDRLTLTCRMDFNKDGIMTDYDIFDSVIHSDERCTYAKVNEYLENPGSHPAYDKVGDMLRDFSDLATVLKKQTKERGHIDFETKEAYFVLDEKGKPVDVVVKERGWAEQMIEEAMIAANVAVAHELHSKKLPGMYRVHENPDPEKIEALINMAKSMNVKCDLNPNNTRPLDVAKFLSSIEDESVRQILSSVAIRSMQKARYSEENLGHYGLALEEYCHFTSPIRRYPDLLIHRMLKRHVIDKKNDEKTLRKDEKKMKKSALHLSEKERDAVTLEREVNDLKSAQYMENKVGQEFEGIVSGVTSFGFFVELDNTIEGLIPLRTMKDDYYVFDQDTLSLTGENTGKKFSMGQPVKVRLSDVNVPKRQVTFELIDEPKDLPVKVDEEAELPVVEGEVTEVKETKVPEAAV